VGFCFGFIFSGCKTDSSLNPRQMCAASAFLVQYLHFGYQSLQALTADRLERAVRIEPVGVANKEGAHGDHDMTDNYRKVLGSKALNVGMSNVAGPVNITRFVCGSSGVDLQECLDRTFPAD
jgi:hypothetical protein